MNLLTKYISDYSGHLEKIMFSGITNYRSEMLDDEVPNCIELAIGFDLMQLGYCLHTDVREIIFNAEKVDKVELST